MTDKQIERLRNEVPRFIDGIPCKLTKEQEQLHRELDCRDMINSCLCYGYDFLNSSYSKSYIEELGIELNRGKIVVNENLETSVEGIYAIGDLINTPMLAHVASKEGIIAVENAFGKSKTIKLFFIK